jgi:uncharacterized protein (TIGR02246 family)
VDHRAADEATIRGLDSAWAKAAAAKDSVQTTSFYSTEAMFFGPGEPVAVGRPDIQKAWSAMMRNPGYAVSFTPDKITVAGDMAYDIGTYELTQRGKGGKQMVSKGRYVVVWSRQADGTWKVVVDAPTTTT